MALISCYECASEISTAAAACPKCGAPNKMTAHPVLAKQPEKTRPIAKFLGIAIVAVFGFIFFLKPDSPPSIQSNTKPSISVEAEKLSADYNENEVAADNKYKDRRLIVAGVVESINKDFKNSVWVGLRTDNRFMPIHAEGLSTEQVSKLKRGDVVAVICVGAGMILSSPFLKDCTL